MDDGLDDLQFDFDDEDDDLLLAGAVDEASIAIDEVDGFVAGTSDHDGEDVANISLGVGHSEVSATQNFKESGFDRSAGQLWIYPTNYPVRDYQYNIVQQALHRNTLVVLPTGLGKTFIAAVVMYNMYRWFPQGKVVFMAPTKPLVAQQINACYTIVGIPREDTIEMTGSMNPVDRERMWRQKRVIFLTPQVMTNDLSRGSFSATSIKCLVVDEAHKALGNHAYCQVVQGLLNFTQEFRVLALSATPGSDLKKVQQVMCNLLIAHIELRSEESIDIRPYTHERKVEKIVVPMGEELSRIRLKYLQVLEMVVSRLVKQRVLFNKNPAMLSMFLILKARDEFRQNPPSHIQGPQYGTVEADFATAMSLYHGFELLQLHGLRSLYNFLLGIQSGEKGYGRTRYELCRNADFIEIMEQLQGKFAWKNLNGPGQDKDAKMAVGHPKMQRLEEVVVEHFKSFQERNMDTRVMIFSQYRDSVEEIRNILSQHQPLVKVMMFIGQSSVGRSTKGYTQKEQLAVMKHFREGGYNTLVSTCVGEEGLDIGDVDLIVCFDAHKSPIRLVQRMGRTGRKRMGRIVMLVTKGKEEKIYNQSLYSKNSIHKAILNGARTLHFYPNNPPLIPPGIKPKCHKMHITVKQPDANNKKDKPSTSGKSRSKGSAGNGSDISTVFEKARSKQSSSEISNAEYEEIRKEFCQISKTAKHLPRPKCTILSKDQGLGADPKDRPMINLSEWTPWQNRLQRAHLTGHSSTTCNLVQTCEFIELQQSIGEDANGYGLEMRLYLNKTDIMNSSSLNQSIANVSGQSSIKSFFSPSQNSKQGDQSSKMDSEKLALISKKSDKIRPNISEKLKKADKKSKKNGASKSSSTSSVRMDQSTSNTSSLFTSIVPIGEKQDDILDIEMITHETFGEKNGKSHLRGNSNVKMPPRKTKANKRKLLNKNDAIWKDDNASRDSGNGTSRAKNLLSNASMSDIVIANEGFQMDVEEEYVFHGKEDKESNLNKLSRSVKNRSCNNEVSTETTIPNMDISMNDPIVIDVDQELQDEKSDGDIDSLREDCNDGCMFPSPPRVEEVGEMFERLESPIDFASLDVYKLADTWGKLGDIHNPAYSTTTDALGQDRNLSPKKYLPTVENRVGPGIKMIECDNMNDRPCIEQPETGSEGLANEPMIHVPKSNVSMSRQDQEDMCFIESDGNDIHDNSHNDECALPSPSKPNTSKRNSSSRANSTLHEDVNVRTKLSVNVDHDQVSHKGRRNRMSPNDSNLNLELSMDLDFDQTPPRRRSVKLSPRDSKIKTKLSVDVGHTETVNEIVSCKVSPTRFFDSFNDVMEAIELDDQLFSPASVKRKGSRGKLENVSTQNTSSGNISLATFSLALGCLHSSSSENLLSPTNSDSRKDSSVFSPPGPGPKKFTNLKSTKSFSVSLLDTENHQPEDVFASSPELEKNLDVKHKVGAETKQAVNSSPDKLANDSDLDEFGSNDECYASDIIPPTPTKNSSGKSTITMGFNSQCSQSSLIGSRKSAQTYQQEQEKNRRPSDKTLTAFNNCFKTSNVLSKKSSNPLRLDENTSTHSNKRQPNLVNYSSHIFSSNEENVPMHSKSDDIVEMKQQNTDQEEDCIVLSPPTKNQKLPFASCENGTCIEILDSQPQPRQLQQQMNNSLPPAKQSPLHPRSEAQDPTTWNTPKTSRSATKSFLSSTKKKKLTLKSGEGSNVNEDECFSTLSPLWNRAATSKADRNGSFLSRPKAGRISASTPMSKMLGALTMPGDDDEAEFVIDAMLATNDLTPIRGRSPSSMNEGDGEKSFIRRRKRKPAAVIDSSSSDNEPSVSKKTSWLSSKRKSQNKSTDSKKDKSKSLEEWQSACLEDQEDGDDFEDVEPLFSKAKKSSDTRKAKVKAKSVKRSKKDIGLIDHEADVSGNEGSSDEDEGDGDDYYEASFINNDTEMASTEADNSDMRAVYLKSVKSPVRGKYKLQFNHAHNTDIFSQAVPASQGLSEYEEDSFCVGSDEEDSISPVKKAKKKKHKDRKHKKGKERKDPKKRRVVCMISNSSSEHENDNEFPFTQEVTTNQRAIAQRALMSSSEDEEMQNLAGTDQGPASLSGKNGRKTGKVLCDTMDVSKSFSKIEKSPPTSPVIENCPNQHNQNKNLGGLSTLPVFGSESNSVTNFASNSDSTKNRDNYRNDDIAKLDEFMEDFDAADCNTMASCKGAEKVQASKYAEEIETSQMMSNAQEKGLVDTQGSSRKPIDVRNVSGGLTTDCSRDSERSFAKYNKLCDNIDFVKPLDRNNGSPSIKSISTNKVNTIASFPPNKDNSQIVAAGRDIAREERLKRQKEKQERYRQKLAQVQKQQQVQQQQQPTSEMNRTSRLENASPSMAKATNSFAHPSPLSASAHLPPLKSPVVTPSISHSSPTTSFNNSPSSSSNISANTSTTAGAESLQILVDTREISGGQDVISALRLKHSLTVTAKQLASCDYVLSNHLVVDRMYWSAFSNGSNRSKLTVRLCEMQTLYRKCAIIIEADKVKVKTGQDKQRKCTMSHSKYTDKTMACLIQTGIKIYFSDSAEQTACLLSELCQAERRKGRHLTVPVKLSDKKEGMFNFVMSIPQINIVEALNLVHKYSNLSEIVSSPAAVLQKRGCLSSEKVQWVYNYLRHSFDSQMLPASYR